MTIPTLARTCGTLAALALLGAAHARLAHAQPAVPRPDSATARPQHRGGVSGGVNGDKKPAAPTTMGGAYGGVLGDKSAKNATMTSGRAADTSAARARKP